VTNRTSFYQPSDPDAFQVGRLFPPSRPDGCTLIPLQECVKTQNTRYWGLGVAYNYLLDVMRYQ